MAVVRKVAAAILLMAAPLLAQVRATASGAPAAATGPVFQASAGYTYLLMGTPSQPQTALNGVDGAALLDLTSHWGLTADASYVRTGDVFATSHSGNVISLLAGPVLYPASWRKTRIFVRGLAGVGWVNSAVPVTDHYYLGGSVVRFSYAMGGGVEQIVSGRLSVRAGCDYLRTAFANPSGAIEPQNNLRMVGSIVYRFGKR
ncbi:MAG: outer membrane protein [Terriglobales bacterium]